MTDVPKFERILERQVRSWEIRRKLSGEGGEAAREALVHLREGPWISVSRQLGSGGSEVAREIAEGLGWQVYDREILSAIAEHSPSRERILSRLDARAIGPVHDYISHLFVSHDPGQPTYLQKMTEVILGLAKQGNAVVLGRGANWFLDGRYGLRVRFVAPLAVRVTRVCDEQGLEGSEAERRVLQHDADRKEFIREYYGRDINDPQGYDLTVNCGAIDRHTATQVVLTALREKLHRSDL